MAEISDLLGLWNDKSRQSADVKRLAQAHIAELERRIETMRQMGETLKALIHSCAGDERPDCPILSTLEQPGGPRRGAKGADRRCATSVREPPGRNTAHGHTE